MKRSITKASVYCSLLLSLAGAAKAQTADTVAEFKPSGKLWGYAFGDYAFKGSADNVGTSTAMRGNVNQYTGMPANTSMFQFRRIYLGYNYDISQKFSAEFLLAAEDNFATNGLDLGGAAANTGDLLANNKFSPYIKLANVRWKNIFKNSDFVFGEQATPTFAKTGRNDQTSEEIWGYRSIERTITDIRRTPSYDMGASLQGWFDNKGRFGYTLLVGNGSSAKPETDQYKWFYGDVYAKFFNKRLIIDLYQDYERLNWGVWIPAAKGTGESPNGPWYHDRNMTKLFLAWTDKKFSVGAEVFQNTILGDTKVGGTDGNTYYRTSKSMGESVFVRGRIISNKTTGNALLGFFARYDNYDPSGNLSNVVDMPGVKTYSGVTSNYEPTTKEQFVTFGLDYTPIKNVHIMPNVWLNTYNSDLSATGTDKAGFAYNKVNGFVNNIKGTDAVYRLTFYYIYGK